LEHVDYTVDRDARLVRVTVHKKMSPESIVALYERILQDPSYQPGFGLIFDRRAVAVAAPADTVRAFTRFARDHAAQMGTCRMAIITQKGMSEAEWRTAFHLLTHYTTVTLEVFDDAAAAERWVQAQSAEHEAHHDVS
jgi:hypothetical protein